MWWFLIDNLSVNPIETRLGLSMVYQSRAWHGQNGTDVVDIVERLFHST